MAPPVCEGLGHWSKDTHAVSTLHPDPGSIRAKLQKRILYFLWHIFKIQKLIRKLSWGVTPTQVKLQEAYHVVSCSEKNWKLLADCKDSDAVVSDLFCLVQWAEKLQIRKGTVEAMVSPTMSELHQAISNLDIKDRCRESKASHQCEYKANQKKV